MTQLQIQPDVKVSASGVRGRMTLQEVGDGGDAPGVTTLFQDVGNWSAANSRRRFAKGAAEVLHPPARRGAGEADVAFDARVRAVAQARRDATGAIQRLLVDAVAEADRAAAAAGARDPGADGSIAPADARPTGAEDWRPPHLSQQVNAERLVYLLRGDARYNTGRGAWMVFRPAEGRFVPDDTGAVARAAKRVGRQAWAFVGDPPPGVDRDAARKHALDSEKAAGVAAMMTLARTEPGVSVAPADFDRDPFLLNVLNGTVDLRTGRFRGHDRADLMTKLAPVRFDPAARCPRFLKFLHRVMGGNDGMAGYLQRLAGLCLTGDATVQELWIPWGGGQNGKSVFFDTLVAMLGDYAGVAPESLLTARHQPEHPTEVADLCGKRLVVASETEQGSALRVQLVKRLTGDRTVKARFMRQDFFEFVRTHKLVLVTNNKPEIGETTHAIWRRLRLVPFVVTIPDAEKDEGLLGKLRGEWPGILNWCVEGCRRWREGGMRPPPEVLVATAEYQAQQDPLREFVEDRCVTGETQFVGRTELLACYQEWAKRTGNRNPLERKEFYEKLRQVPGVGEGARRVGGEPRRGFTGIGLADLSSQLRHAQEQLEGRDAG